MHVRMTRRVESPYLAGQPFQVQIFRVFESQSRPGRITEMRRNQRLEKCEGFQYGQSMGKGPLRAILQEAVCSYLYTV
jgi:hypothetical protein